MTTTLQPWALFNMNTLHRDIKRHKWTHILLYGQHTVENKKLILSKKSLGIQRQSYPVTFQGCLQEWNIQDVAERHVHCWQKTMLIPWPSTSISSCSCRSVSNTSASLGNSRDLYPLGVVREPFKHDKISGLSFHYLTVTSVTFMTRVDSVQMK